MADKDFVIYMDTDSIFIAMENFLLHRGMNLEKWKALSNDKKIEGILKLSRCIEKYVNDICFKELQQGTYNSIVDQDDFSIVFKQEIICKTALFVAKKKYGFHVVNNEGVMQDKIDVTGLEIIRSETPSAFKVILKDILRFILENKPDSEIIKFVDDCKSHIKERQPSEISSNISINKMNKYIVNDEPIKGTPYHIKGAANYHKLIKLFGLDDKYEEIVEGNKAKVVYVKPNQYDVGVISYIIWPKEFEDYGIFPDYEKMIEKFLINKIAILLEPMNKKEILERSSTFNLFFN